jgi:hypothetical protein
VKAFIRASCAALGLFGAACSRPEVPVMDVPTGWTKLRVHDDFTLYAPPGTIFHEGQGAASVVGRFDGANFYLMFDYGGQSIPSTIAPDDQDHRIEHFGIGGQLVQFAVGPSQGLEDCGQGKEVATVSMQAEGTSQIGQSKSLTIFACMDSSSQTGTVRSIVRTIRFLN